MITIMSENRVGRSLRSGIPCIASAGGRSTDRRPAPGRFRPHPHQSLDIGDAVMRSGRPMLLVPPGKKTHLGLDRILIVWKDTTEARRAVSVALPLLKRTKDVTIVEIVADGQRRPIDLGQTANAALRLVF